MRSKKALYNILSQSIYEITLFVCNLILPRLIISSYGSEYNGLISSVTQFLEYISILTLGISGSVRIAIYSAKGDINKISRVIKSTQNFMKKISFIFIIYVIILTFLYPIIVKSSIDNIQISILILIIGIGVFCEYFFGITYIAFVSAMQTRYIYNIILIFAKLSSTIISVILIKKESNIYIVKLVSVLCISLVPILLNIIINKKFNIDKSAIPDNSVLVQRKDIMAHSIANSVHQYTDIFLLSVFMDTKLISVYSIYTLILGGIKKIETIFTNGLEGAFGDIWSRGQNETFKKNFDIFEYLIFCFISVIFSCTAYLILPFVNLYTKNITDINYIIPMFAYLSVFTYAIYSMRTPYLVCIQAAGKYKETKKMAIIEAIVNFTISVFLIIPMGIIGVTIGTLVANLYRTIEYQRFLSNKLINRSSMVFFKRIIWLLSCFLLFAIAKNILPNIDITTWSDWIFSGIYYFAISITITILMSIFFYRKQFNSSLQLIKKMIKRRSDL